MRSLQEDVTYFVESNTVCTLFVCFMCVLIQVPRTRTSRNMRGSTMNSTSTKRKRNSALLKRKLNHQTQKTRAKVELVLESTVRSKFTLISTADLPARTPLHRKSEDDSIANKRDGSPVLKKTPVTTQRSELTLFFSILTQCDRYFMVPETSIASECKDHFVGYFQLMLTLIYPQRNRPRLQTLRNNRCRASSRLAFLNNRGHRRH